MRLISFNFNKINVERITETNERIKINTNIDISSIEKPKVDLFNDKEDVIQVKFQYVIDYEPNFAKIEFNGSFFMILDSKDSKELLKKWKDKEIPEDIRLFIFNVILMKSNIKALQFEDEFGFPLHIPLPRFSKEEKKQD
jgi:hypothetical protein